MNNYPIGVFDSGVGGLSIWKEIVKELPYEPTVYIADSKNCPYGNRSSKEIYQLSKRLIRFLLEKQCKLIVLACNTITVSCLDKLRSDFSQVPIIGTVPVVKTASKLSRKKIIGILSTKRTAESEYQKRLIQRHASDCKVVNIGTDKLVPFIERGEIDSKDLKEVLRNELTPFLDLSSRGIALGDDVAISKQRLLLLRQVFDSEVAQTREAQDRNDNRGIDTLALGCSHFSFLKDQIQKILGSNILILDSGAAIARQVKRVLTNNNMLSLQNKLQYRFYTTGNKDQFAIIARKLMHSERILLVQGVSL